MRGARKEAPGQTLSDPAKSSTCQVLEGGDNEGRTFDATCVEGDRFPSTRIGAGVHYELKYGAPYSHRHHAGR